MYFSCLLYYASLHTHFGSGLFNVQSWFQARTKVSNTTITDLLCADDAAPVAHTSEDLQALLDRLATACTAFRLKTNNKKTVVIYQAVANQPATGESEIKVNGKKLAIVEQFSFLRSATSEIICHQKCGNGSRTKPPHWLRC